MAAANKPTQGVYEFGRFRLDAAQRLLWRDGEIVPMPPRVFDTLLVLVENSGHLLEKDDLMRRLWPDTIVEEVTLARNISDLRKVLGETEGGQKYIETVPRRGYQFVAPVRQPGANVVDLVVEKRARARVIAEEGEAAAALPPPLRQSDEGPRPGRLRATWLVVFVAVVAGTAALFYFWTGRTKEAGLVKPIRSIAVLPFKPLTADRRDESLEVGMADTLITKLSGLKQLTVRPISAVRKYSALDQDPVAVGRELRVEAVLEGSIQWDAESRVRVTARLWQVEDNALLWADNCVEQCADIFALQDAVSARVVAALATTLTGAEQQMLAKHYTESAEAYQLYLKGRYFWNQKTAQGLKKAIEHFQQAIRVDPDYALAYTGLADSYAVMGSLGMISSQESRRQAKAAATKALELDEALAEAHASLAWLDWWDWAGAEREFKRALELNPNDATARQWHAEYLAALGRFDEAIAEIRRALHIDPTSLTINAIAGQTYWVARRYDEAIEQCQKTLELDPNFFLGHHFLAGAYAEKGRYEEALAAAKKAKELEDNPITLYLIGYIYATSGSRAEAEQVQRELIGISKRKYVPSYNVAGLYATLGEREAAFAWLEKAVNAQEEHLIWLKVDPHLDPLRSDPRFADLLRRVGLAS